MTRRTGSRARPGRSPPDCCSSRAGLCCRRLPLAGADGRPARHARAMPAPGPRRLSTLHVDVDVMSSANQAASLNQSIGRPLPPCRLSLQPPCAACRAARAVSSRPAARLNLANLQPVRRSTGMRGGGGLCTNRPYPAGPTLHSLCSQLTAQWHASLACSSSFYSLAPRRWSPWSSPYRVKLAH